LKQCDRRAGAARGDADRLDDRRATAHGREPPSTTSSRVSARNSPPAKRWRAKGASSRKSALHMTDKAPIGTFRNQN
jgi:hypothetical protein